MQPNSTCCEEGVGSSWPTQSLDFVLCGHFISHDPWGGGVHLLLKINNHMHSQLTLRISYVIGFE